MSEILISLIVTHTPSSRHTKGKEKMSSKDYWKLILSKYHTKKKGG